MHHKTGVSNHFYCVPYCHLCIFVSPIVKCAQRQVYVNRQLFASLPPCYMPSSLVALVIYFDKRMYQYVHKSMCIFNLSAKPHFASTPSRVFLSLSLSLQVAHFIEIT